MFIVSIIALVIMVAALVACKACANKYKKETNKYSREDAKNAAIGTLVVAATAGVAAIGTACSACLYTQDPGQASVLVSFTGEVQGINYDTGLHFKAPWTHRVEYDIRNNTLSYVGTDDNNSDHAGGDVTGAQITFQDADGVTGNIDLVIRYSIRGEAVGDIYNEYKTQQEFVHATLAQDVRSQTREILSKYNTLKVYSDRDDIKDALYSKLSDRWDKLGVDIEEAYLQEVRYSDSVKAAFDAAQTARTKVETAKAEQEQAKIEAETNKIKSQALSNAILKEKLIEAIKNGNGTYIIDTNNIAIGVK